MNTSFNGYKKYIQESEYIGDYNSGRVFVTFAAKSDDEPVMFFQHTAGYNNWRRQLQEIDGYFYDEDEKTWVHWGDMEID